MSTPAGWYPQSDGRQRYWDGAQWTEHFAPGTAEASAPVSAAPKAKGPWYSKKAVLIPAGIVALLIVGGALSGGGDDEVPVSADSQVTSSSSVVTSSAPRSRRYQRGYAHSSRR